MQNLLDTPQEPENNNQEAKWDQIASFSNTKIENWNNAEIVDWITSVNFRYEDYQLIVSEIKDSGCTGEDIMTLESAQDFADAFGINNNASCKVLFASMSIFKAKCHWENIPIEEWSNQNVLSWINSLTIDNKYKATMISNVTDMTCTGEDIAFLEAEDIGQAFQINNQIVCNQLFSTIQTLKSVSTNDNNIAEIEIDELKDNPTHNSTPTTGLTDHVFFIGEDIECSDTNVDNKWYGGKIKKIESNRILVQFFAFMSDQWILEQHYNIRIRNPKTKRPFGNDITAPSQNVLIDTPEEPTPSQPVTQIVSDDENEIEEEEKKFVSEVNYSWREKKMRDWINVEILDWIKCMNLGTEWNNKILPVIEMNECTGEDIVELKTGNDVCDAFEIDDNEMCERISTEIKHFRPDLQGDDDSVRINVFYKNENIILDEEFIKTDMISKVKIRFKIQLGIDFELKHIHFRYKNEELIDTNRLEEYNISDDNNLLKVRLDNVFPIFIFAQGNNLTLNEKVTKECTIRKIKQMYKKQSGVQSNIEDILFYNIKQNVLLKSNKTLAQCGIVDDKNLITVRFGTDGGKE